MTPAKADSPMPLSEKVPKGMTAPPMPKVRATLTMMMLRVSLRFTLLLMRF